MAVEQLTVNLGTTSAYDTVTAVIRGKTVPVEDQCFNIDLDGMQVNFQIETVDEKPRGPAESIYSITGRENRSIWLYTPVDFTMNMVLSGSSYVMPKASAILSAAGITHSYNAPDFTPTAGGMGWTVKAVSGGKTVRIREKNFQALLSKLFSWTAEFGPKKICWHVRAGVCHVWEQNRIFGSTLTLTDSMIPRDGLNISSKKLRTYTEATDSSGNDVSTPNGAYSFAWNYADVPFNGIHYGPGGSVCSYSDGLLDKSVKTTESSTTTEEYSYTTFWGAPCQTKKKTTIVETSEEETTTRIIETTSEYDRQYEGATAGSGRDVPVLSREVTQSWTNGELDSEKTVVEYYSGGKGFYSITATKYVDGAVDQVQHSASRSAPGGAASQATEKQCIGYTVTVSGGSAGYSTIATRLPIEYSEALEYLGVIEALNGVRERKITAEVVGQSAFNPIGGAIIYRGVTYFATESRVSRTPTTKRMSIEGIRWG